MAKKDLIATAKSLGLKTKGLNVAQLEKAIADHASADANTDTTSTEEVNNSLEADLETVQLQEAAEKAQADADAKKVAFEEAQAIADEAKEALYNKEIETAKAEKFANAYKHEGKYYALSPRTPKTLKVLEDVYTQEELLNNTEAMEFLIVGKSCFIKELK